MRSLNLKDEEEYEPDSNVFWEVLSLNMRGKLVSILGPQHQCTLTSSFTGMLFRLDNKIVARTTFPTNPDWGNLMVHGPHVVMPMVDIAEQLSNRFAFEQVTEMKSVQFLKPIQSELVICVTPESHHSGDDVVRAELQTNNDQILYATAQASTIPLRGGQYSTMQDRKKLLAQNSCIDHKNSHASFELRTDFAATPDECCSSGFSMCAVMDIVMKIMGRLRNTKVIPALFWLGVGARNIKRINFARLTKGSSIRVNWKSVRENDRFNFVEVHFVFSDPDGAEITSGIVTLARPRNKESGMNYLKKLYNDNIIEKEAGME